MESACVIFGSCPQPICKNGYVMVLDAVFGCDWALVSWAPILDRKQIKATMRIRNMCVVRDPESRFTFTGTLNVAATDRSTWTKPRFARSRAECGIVAWSASIVAKTTMGAKGLGQNRYGWTVVNFLFFVI